MSPHQELITELAQHEELVDGFVETIRAHAGQTLTPEQCLEWLQAHLARRAAIADRAREAA